LPAVIIIQTGFARSPDLSDRSDSHPVLLESMIDAALEAGRAAHGIYLGHFEVQLKADQSPVTAADHASEAIILERLRRAAPAVPVVAEEEVAAGRQPAIGKEFFLVDPLDGTKEFIQRNGDFTINIALVRDGDPVLGVVYAPVTSALYIGDVIAGHALRGHCPPDSRVVTPREPIQVRRPPAQGLTAVVSRSHSTPETETYLRHYQIAQRVSVGSSLKFCLVAAGEADLYPRLGPTMEWDTAAGQAVLVAAGGSVLAPGGAPLSYGKPGLRNSFFVAGGLVHTVPLAS
jgi:3'(2'), 5'-bisphosphate nucleotidase